MFVIYTLYNKDQITICCGLNDSDGNENDDNETDKTTMIIAGW